MAPQLGEIRGSIQIPKAIIGKAGRRTVHPKYAQMTVLENGRHLIEIPLEVRL